MSNYRRLISYIYAYEGGIKGKNIGFAKIETRGIQCKITVSVKRIYVGGNDIGVYLLAGDQEIYLGNIFIRGGSGEFRTVVSVTDIEHSGIGTDLCYGLTIHDVKNTWRSYTTIWEDSVAHAAEVELRSMAGKKKEDSAVSEEQIKKAVREIDEEFPLEQTGDECVEKESTERDTSDTVDQEDQETEAEQEIQEQKTDQVNQEAEEERESQEVEEEQESQEVEEEQENQEAEEEQETQEVEEQIQEESGEEGTNVRPSVTGPTAGWQHGDAPSITAPFPEFKRNTQPTMTGPLPGWWQQPIGDTGPVQETPPNNGRIPLNLTPGYPAPGMGATGQMQPNQPVPGRGMIQPNQPVSGLPRQSGQSVARRSISETEQELMYRNPGDQKRNKFIFRDSNIAEHPSVAFQNQQELDRLSQNEKIGGTHELVWEKLKKEHTRILAFDYEDGCEILTIKPQDIGLLPRDAWLYGNNSFLLHGYYNFRYLILSKLNNPQGTPRYLLGVPGHYYSNERYMASMFGFPNFVLSKEQPIKDGRFGFWYTDIKLGGS
ncbi:DUF6128 domain-containing protein [Clostridium sp. E02]|uniref:DUF6128 domain-containing protein n=1 Tax=Clostridium sp. E02 TaxID=2487134 RepID=UPI000F54A45C|nr:DUF6128 domain-containing protein [Clostridium sp. E02]